MQKEARRWWDQATRMVRESGYQPDIFAEWVQQLASRDPQTAVPATWALQQAGVAVIPALLAGLTHPHTRVRRGCVDIIDHGGYGGDARCVAALLPLLADPVPHIRRAAWHTLCCERCKDSTKCEVKLATPLDQVGLLVEIGIHDTNPKLRQQLLGELATHVADARARDALAQLIETEQDAATVQMAKQALAYS